MRHIISPAAAIKAVSAKVSIVAWAAQTGRSAHNALISCCMD
jgi:hypothetical protein